jgi:purine-binding chemotaxis protein CheW
MIAHRSETAETALIHLLRFSLDGQHYALNLQTVERVIRAVELSVLPGCPPVIRGVFNLRGRIIPVADPRRRLGLPEREIALDDRIIIARTPRRLLGMLADADTEVAECAQEKIVASEAVLCGADLVEGVGRLSDGLVLIQNLAKFLSMDEEASLAEALDARR